MHINDNSSDDLVDCTPPEVLKSAKNSSLELLAIISRARYQIFLKIQTAYGPNILCCEVGTLSVYHNIDITKYFKLKALLKRKSDGYIPKKSKTLTTKQINQFLHEAPDTQHLFTKVALIVGISRACRKQELSHLKLENIESLGLQLLEFHKTFEKYANLRPTDIQESHFFLNYQREKCTKQAVVGVNKFGNIPKLIANYLHLGLAKRKLNTKFCQPYLHLKDPNLYTGHCFRRSSATILVDAGGDITALKRHGGWKSTAVAETYIDESITNKIEISNKILEAVNTSSTSNTSVSTPTATSELFMPMINESPTLQMTQEQSLTHNLNTHKYHVLLIFLIVTITP
ncbi:hypothetical protein NQ315_006146 [Exocentrus adspersus]|uniref:Tyr recombinase domain-containing protein n=1 Tax=Exocentrus adspersus TaxID=1586481 RepID=A0AAV8VD29_9CUCU|nr:hypothetical protein NQ315_006146 [Exocentrus adspersus]